MRPLACPRFRDPLLFMKTITTDPVCGMEVDSDSPWSLALENGLFRFCSPSCRQRFPRHPKHFTEIREEHDKSPGPSERNSGEKVRQKGRGAKWSDYLPLVVLVLLTMLAAAAKQAAYAGGWDTMAWMRDFMGFFLVVFSMFKFFNLSGFADGFRMYDLLANRPYAYLYPFLELGLGLGFLANWQPVIVSTATILLLVFGSLGVFRALWKGLDLECACMGTVLKVPLSTVALVEDLGMAAMAGAMLYFGGR